MPRSTFLTLLFVLLFAVRAFAETDSLPARYFSLGSKKVGICFGNSPAYTGFRFNVMNKRIRTLNGFDFTLLDDDEDGKSNGISVGIIAKTQHQNNGLSIGGIVNALDRANGIMVGPVISRVGRLNGIGIGSVLIPDTLNGLVMNTLLLDKHLADSARSVIRGVVVSVFRIDVGKMNGIAISIYNRAQAHNGLVVGAVNKSSRLKGIQIGLYNVALNNPRRLRRLPFINMHLGK
ncbi:LA_2272 family surface repeat-containing protein [Chitinophaga ginsengisoli]|uniref:Uncharacterized protein n=1 Tax=Chitinophaga ginsengisoli TaxID=363837 RepID=A0A2P8GDY1_9BACT|nr:hypothetical protein [Chitinophaga ginsengisoli]PSL32194.1 hypothetical protein CLV42_104497 [Chitinophaga ginsengisoli]